MNYNKCTTTGVDIDNGYGEGVGEREIYKKSITSQFAVNTKLL